MKKKSENLEIEKEQSNVKKVLKNKIKEDPEFKNALYQQMRNSLIIAGISPSEIPGEEDFENSIKTGDKLISMQADIGTSKKSFSATNALRPISSEDISYNAYWWGQCVSFDEDAVQWVEAAGGTNAAITGIIGLFCFPAGIISVILSVYWLSVPLIDEGDGVKFCMSWPAPGVWIPTAR